ncbi:MAG: glycosyltransferase, partial [Longimicrobiaceae bacterium]
QPQVPTLRGPAARAGRDAAPAPAPAPATGAGAMRVLHLITTIDRGGAENHLVDLVRVQRAAGLEVTVAWLKGGGYWAAELRRLGARVAPLGMRFYGDPRALLRLRAALREARPALVHAHLPPAELYARAALRGSVLGSLPLVISKHNDTDFVQRTRWSALPLARWAGRRAGAIIAISEAVRARVLGERLAAAADRVVTIHYGLDPAPFAARDEDAVRRLREAWGVPPGAVLFGTAARMVPQKSLHTLLEGYARLRRDHPGAGARLALVGTGPLEPALRAQAAALGIGHECVWAGFREDIPTVMQALDVFALTSLWEGLGLVLLEAMAAGRPAVASRVSAIPEIVEDGRTGTLFPVGDADALAAALAGFLDPERRRACGEAGRRRAALFSVARMAEATLEVYRRVLAHAP